MIGCRVGSIQPCHGSHYAYKGGEATFGERERVFQREVYPAGAVGRGVRGHPTISHGPDIPKVILVECKPQLHQGERCQPHRGTLLLGKIHGVFQLVTQDGFDVDGKGH